MSYTSYARSQGNQIMDAVWYAQRGNYRPLALTIGLYGPVGILLNALKDAVLKRKRDEEDEKTFWLSLIDGYMEMATFGLVGWMAENIYWKSKMNKESIASMPAADTLVGILLDTGRNLINVTEGEFLEKEYIAIVRRMSLLKAIDAHLEGPYWQRSNKPNKMKSKKKREIRYSRATAQ